MRLSWLENAHSRERFGGFGILTGKVGQGDLDFVVRSGFVSNMSVHASL